MMDGGLPPPTTRPFKFNARYGGMQAHSRKVMKVIQRIGKHVLSQDVSFHAAPRDMAVTSP